VGLASLWIFSILELGTGGAGRAVLFIWDC
jgi:hypothetical protein